MRMSDIPFGTTDWAAITPTEHAGEHLRRMYSGTSQRPWCPTWRRTRTQSEGFGARKAHRKLGYHRVGAKSAWSAAAPPDRTGTRSSPMPDGEELAALARSGATLAIHLSIRSIAAVCDALAPLYGADCPAAVVYRASWPDERIVAGTLGDLAEKVRPLRFRRTALILVGRVLGAETFDESALYDAAHHHLLRPRKKRRAR